MKQRGKNLFKDTIASIPRICQDPAFRLAFFSKVGYVAPGSADRSTHRTTRVIRASRSRKQVKRLSHPWPDLSLVIPAYNEASRLPAFLQRVEAYLKKKGQPSEIIVVDDGSLDKTSEAVSALACRLPHIRLIRSACNLGKGAAVRLGMQNARGRLRLFTDADGATPIEELGRLEQAVAEGADIAIGSRALAARDPRYAVRARRHRSVLGSFFNAAVQSLGLQGIQDTQCGFKLFRGSVAQDLFSVARVNGYGFDLELLYLAKRRGYHIAEVPVNWADQPGSKVRPLWDGPAMLCEFLSMRRRHAQGDYESLAAALSWSRRHSTRVTKPPSEAPAHDHDFRVGVELPPA
jgi:dolichyl-phosphate beta-glucosyltransferase